MDDQRKTNLILKDPKRNTQNNYRPITCLLMMWQTSTAEIIDIYNSLISCRLFYEEQKIYLKGTRGIGDLRYIDQNIPKDRKMRCKNLAIVYIDNKKAYDTISQSLIKASKSVQDIRPRYKVYWGIHEKLKSAFDRRMKKMSWDENPRRCIQGWCAITISICNRDDVIQSHS